MKKLSLKLGGVKEMLSKEQMRKITGGANYLCACQSIYNEWGCITIQGCMEAGDSICPNDYRCTLIG